MAAGDYRAAVVALMAVHAPRIIQSTAAANELTAAYDFGVQTMADNYGEIDVVCLATDPVLVGLGLLEAVLYLSNLIPKFLTQEGQQFVEYWEKRKDAKLKTMKALESKPRKISLNADSINKSYPFGNLPWLKRTTEIEIEDED